ncbi:hypothetical protein [Glutamicibacter sp. NPDC087344]|uniref:hypothetical protein n=1 Tax=Glutamicibacter sp. NPDC087344 TaxID=3363994 RepID=UPI00381E3E7C
MDSKIRARCASCRTALRRSEDGAWFGPAGYALCSACRFQEHRITAENTPES